MSFHHSSQIDSIELVGPEGEAPHILVAHVQNADGEWCESSINLNDFIGNDDGWFTWDGVNFSESAQEVSLDKEREDGHIWLVGRLTMIDGGHRDLQGIALSEKIENQNGTLVYLG